MYPKQYKKTILLNFVAKHSYAYELRMIEGLIANNCLVIAIASKNMPEIEEWEKINGLKIYQVDGYSSMVDFLPKLLKYIIFDAPRIRKIARKYSVSWVFDPIFTYWTYFVNVSLRKYPFVYTLHDPVPHSSKDYIHNFFNEKLVKKAKKVVILSKTFKEYTCEHYRKMPKDVLVIPEGSNVQIDFSDSIRLVNYKDSDINFVFQGRIDEYKGINILMKAYQKLYCENKNITLTIAGSGDISKYVNDLNKLPNCTVINRWLNNEEVVGLFNDSNTIAVLPYISATQSGVVNVAMPCGAPIIASNTGALGEQITDGIDGFLFESGNVDALYSKMKYVANHKDELDIVRRNAYEHIKKLDWNTLAAKLADAL